MSIKPLNHHYSIENPASVYDEEAMTALQLAGRTTAKVNECVAVVNKTVEDLPEKVADAVQVHIDNGAFDEQIDRYAGELENQIINSDAKQTANLNTATTSLNKRIDNIVSNPGDGTTPTEIIDARQDEHGTTHASLSASIKNQVRQAVNAYTGYVYLGAGNSIEIDEELDDGSIIIHAKGRWSYYGMYKQGLIGWDDGVTSDIADYVTPTVIQDDITYQVDITLPAYKSLVYSKKDFKFHFRSNSYCETDDILLVQNSWSNPFRGCLMDEWKYRKTLENRKNVYTVRGAYMYGGDGFKMEFKKDEDTPALDVTLYGRPTVCYGSEEAYMALFTGDHIEPIKNNVTYPTGTEFIATIKIPGWNALVFNHLDKKWHFRWRAGLVEGDILALATGYCQPLCGTLLEEWSAKKNQEFEKYLGSNTMSYNPPDGVKEFAGHINGAKNVEKFLFFTDPHLSEGAEWQTEFETYKNQLKACYDATPVNFAVCGGDWLGNGDTQAGACFKLGFIDGQMRSIFRDKYYPVVGNHDTNYQGILTEGADPQTGILDNATIQNVWNQPGYYSFDGENTRFFVFDSELDWDLTLSEYKTEQLFWFCQALKNNNQENLGAFIHIYYNNNVVGEMGNKITEIANAFNTRGVITLDGATFDFSECVGKFRFILAGHNHMDYVGVENNIPIILTTNTRDGWEPTFDLCLVNYDTNKLHLCRVGTGESRTVDI